ncbi:MAG: hypothetical protein M3O30_18670 [Planctomycetota bacterium]|nr:hypothetical protein [Planctomycetota bacterium]
MKRFAYLAAATAIFSLVSVCWADPMDVMAAQETVANFGTTGQQSTGVVNGGMACGPTSAYNSFVYLQNELGVTGLLQPTAAGTINQLGSYMGFGDNTHTGVPANGVTSAQFLAGKTQYINAQTLNKQINIESQTGTANITWEFILKQLQNKQDVEIKFNWNSVNGGAHFVTLTGISWDPDLNSGTLSFIDPFNPLGGNNPALPITGTLTGTDGTGFNLAYSGGGAGPDTDPDNPGMAGSGTIFSVAAESPVPEPTALCGLALFVGATLMWRPRAHCRLEPVSDDKMLRRKC